MRDFRTQLQSYYKPQLWLIAAAVMITPLCDCRLSQAQTIQEQYALAAGAYERNQWIESADAFQIVIQKFPGTEQAALANFFLGESLMQQSRYGQAYLAYQTFLKQMPSHQHTLRASFRIGEAAYRIKRDDVAARLLEAFVVTYPKHELNEFALTFLGEVRINRNEPQLAQRAFETCLSLFPNGQFADRCGLGLAKAMLSQGNQVQAIEIYRAIVDQPNARMKGEAKLQLGILSFQYGEHSDTRKWLGEALTECSESQDQAEAAYWLARSEFQAGNAGRAVTLFELASGKTASSQLLEAIYFDGAVSAMQAENYAQAKTWLDRIRRNYSEGRWSDDALYMQADVAYRQNKFDEALALAAQFNEEHDDLENGLKVNEIAGRVYYELGDYEKCVETFSEVINRSMESDDESHLYSRPKWQYMKALAQIGLDDPAAAAETLNDIDPDRLADKLPALVPLTRASCQFKQKNYPELIGDFKKYLYYEPQGDDAVRARSQLTIALAKSKQWDDATLAFLDFKANNEGDSAIVTTAKYLADYAYAEKQLDFAMMCYETMARPGNSKELVAAGLSGLAWGKMESDDANGALATFHRIVNEHPDSKFASEAAMARAKHLDDQGDYKQAGQMYAMVVQKFSQTDLANVARLRLANTMQKIGGKEQLREAKNLLSTYLQNSRTRESKDQALYQLAWVYHDLNLAEHGRKRFQSIVNEFPDSIFWADAAYRLAEYHVQQKQHQLARPLLDQLIQRNTDPEVSSRVLYLHGQVAAADNDWIAVAELMNTLKESTDDARLIAKAKYWAAEAAYQQKNLDEASEIFAELRGDLSELPQSLHPWIWLRAAQCAGIANDWKYAADLVQRAKNLFPEFKSGFEFEYIRGRALANDAKFDEAIEAFNNVINSREGSLTETAAMAQWRIGEAYFHQEEFAEAINAYFRVDSLFDYPKWRAAALLQAGKCQEHLGNWKHAVKLYQQLIQKFPKSDFARDAEKRLVIATRLTNLTDQPNSQK